MDYFISVTHVHKWKCIEQFHSICAVSYHTHIGQENISDSFQSSLMLQWAPHHTWYNMATLPDIANGLKLDWTDDNGLFHRFKCWKRKCQSLIHWQLYEVPEDQQCHFLIYWLGDTGADLVKKWTMNGRLTEDSKKKLESYWTLFEQCITTKSYGLIAVVELKHLFQGSMTLEEFNTRARILMEEAKFPTNAMKQRMLRDTVITGTTDDKIWTKITKEGNAITFNQVMEIARLEVAMQCLLSQMQETSKASIHYLKYGHNSKSHRCNKAKKTAKPGGNGTPGNFQLTSQGSGKDRKTPICFHCGKGKCQKDQQCPASDSICWECGKKGHWANICQSKKKPIHQVMETSNISMGQPDYYNGSGEPIYIAATHMPQA